MNAKKKEKIEHNEMRKRARDEGLDIDAYSGLKCLHCLKTGISDFDVHNQVCEAYQVHKHNSVRYPFQKKRKVLNL